MQFVVYSIPNTCLIRLMIDCLCYIYCIEGSYFPSLLVDWILLVRMTNVNVCGVHIFYILANLSE